MESKRKQFIKKLISKVLYIFIFVSMAFSLFIGFADKIILFPEKRSLILFLSLAIALIVPTEIVVLLRAIEKAEYRNEYLEGEVENLKKENSRLLQNINN